MTEREKRIEILYQILEKQKMLTRRPRSSG